MKTNQIMIRQMGDMSVQQRTKDAYFNATALIKEWNETHGENKRLDVYLKAGPTQEFLKAIENDIISNSTSRWKLQSAYITSRGKQGGTWMHPLLFVDLAMWLDATFKLQVLKFVQDEMIKFRNLAGDAYPRMCKAVGGIIPKEQHNKIFPALAKSINMIVYGRHESEIRNKVGNEGKIREMYELEARIAQWIELGLVNDKKQLSAALNKLYNQKYPPVISL